MKKTFKLLMIFMGGLTAIIVVALSGYFLIANNKTFYIYDVRLVEPVEDKPGFVYYEKSVKKSASEKDEKDPNKELEKEETTEYTPIKNQIVYMKSQATNIYPIAVYVSASISVNQVNITSSDKSIAKIVYKNNSCYVEFLKEGFVTITSEFHGVKDSFSIQIYDQLPSEFTVFDYDYYGDYAEVFPNQIISYADGEEYRYDYILNNVSNTGTNSNIDGDLIRVDQTHLEKHNDIFENVYIDSVTNELVVKCVKPELLYDDNIDSTIVLQSFYYDDNGEVVIENNYPVEVKVVRYIPEFLQIEVSGYADFPEGYVFTNTQRKDISTVITPEMIADPSLITYEVEEELHGCLSAEKAENYLASNGEKSTYRILFNERVKELKIRIRMVYTNGDIVYLKKGVNSVITFNGLNESEHCVLDPTGDFYIMNMRLDGSNFFADTSRKFTIEVEETLTGMNHLSHQFVFEFKSQNDWNSYYTYDSESKTYTFDYWDKRAKFLNEIYDRNGNVIAFGA